MRRIPVLVLVMVALLASLAGSVAVAGEGPSWFKQSFLDINDDVAEAKQANRHLMLYFYQEGCPYCARFQRETLGQQSIVDKTRKHFDVVAIDLRGDREVTDQTGKKLPEKDFAASLNVKFTPTFLMFDQTGHVVLRLNGFQSPQKFDAALDYVAFGAYRQQPEFSRFLEGHMTAQQMKGARGDLVK